jgi:hypothetical protein
MSFEVHFVVQFRSSYECIFFASLDFLVHLGNSQSTSIEHAQRFVGL